MRAISAFFLSCYAVLSTCVKLRRNDETFLSNTVLEEHVLLFSRLSQLCIYSRNTQRVPLIIWERLSLIRNGLHYWNQKSTFKLNIRDLTQRQREWRHRHRRTGERVCGCRRRCRPFRLYDLRSRLLR